MASAFACLTGAGPADAVPAGSASYYVSSYSTKWAYDAGCALGTADKSHDGTQRHVVVLDFGSMSQNSSGTWMVSAFSGSSFSLSSARAMVQEFGRGYWTCTGTDTTSTAFVALGTNNSAGSVTAAAGAALANEAQAAQNTFTSKGYKQVFAIGGNDFESWGHSSSSSTAAVNWINGYNGVAKRPFFVNYGGADGCPTSSIPSSTSCNAGLNAEAIWKVSFSGSAYPLPEIYTSSGNQAAQWKYLSLYAYTKHGARFMFQGVMTQSGACSQASGGCPGADNSPVTGWTQLQNQVNSDSRSATTIPGPTDIRWQ